MLLLLLLVLISASLAKLPREYELFIEYRRTQDPQIAYRILKDYPDAVFKNDLLVLLAKDVVAKGREDEARRLLDTVEPKKVKEDYRDDLLSLWKALNLDKKKALLEDPVLFREFIPQVELTTEEAIRVADTLYRFRYYRDVVKLLERVDFEKACYLLGLSMRALGDEGNAVEVLKRCPDQRATGELALLYFYMGQEELLQDALSQIKDRSLLSNTFLRLGRISISRGNYTKAVEYLMRMEDSYDKFFHLGLAYFATKKYERALESFLSSLSFAQRDEQRSASNFWVYKCKVELGHEDATAYLIKASNGAGFYYAVASRFLNLPVASKALRTVVEDSTFPKTAEVIRSIHDAGFPYYARLEAFKRLGEMSATDVLSIRKFDPYLAIKLAIRKYGYGSMVYNMVAFPKPYKDYVFKASELYQIDPALIYAVMRQESLFDPNATSVAKARGLMQLIDSTAKQVAKKENIQLKNVYDPETNIKLGTAYLRELLDMWNGDLVKAIASYNAGPTRVKAFTPHEDQFVFIESIPLRETREYVKRVLYNYYVYSELLE